MKSMKNPTYTDNVLHSHFRIIDCLLKYAFYAMIALLTDLYLKRKITKAINRIKFFNNLEQLEQFISKKRNLNTDINKNL